MTPEQMRWLAEMDLDDDDAPLGIRHWQEGAKAALHSAADQLDALQLLTLDQQTDAIRRIDREFGAVGGGTTRHWVDYLNCSGYQIVQVSHG